MNYKEAGVDIEKGDAFVERIKKKVKSTYNKNVVAGVGGFSCLYESSPDKYLAAGTDGVGTKLKLAIELGIHNTVGIDLVAMCVNDIICTGAKPLFFMDYMATSNLDLEVSEQIIDGIVEGCRQCEMPLIGGETAEMPGMYENGDYDLAGFSVGEVLKSNVIDGSRVNSGDSIVAFASTGFHSNGYSLIRKIIEGDSREIREKLLTPTKIYHSLVSTILKEYRDSIKGIAHITGGGIDNIKRINSGMSVELNHLPNYCSSEFKANVCDSIEYIAKKSKLSDKELYSTFNMGMGLVFITSEPEKLMDMAKEMNQVCWEIGRVK